MNDYVRQVSTSDKTVSEIQAFIRGHPLVQSIARITVQLDARCYVWDEGHLLEGIVTMTALYTAISQRLWAEYVIRIRRTNQGKRLTKARLQNIDVDFLVEQERMALDALVALLRSADANVRVEAARVLMHQYNSPPSAMEALVALFQGPEGDVRSESHQSNVTWAMVKFRNAQQQSTETTLMALFEDRENEYRPAAALALEMLPSLSASPVGSLVVALQDDDICIRAKAIFALEQQTELSEAAVDALVSTPQDQVPYIRSSAAKALGAPENLPIPALDTLLTLLGDTESDVRSSAIRAL